MAGISVAPTAVDNRMMLRVMMETMNRRASGVVGVKSPKPTVDCLANTDA